MANPTGKNQYSGGGKGGRLQAVKRGLEAPGMARRDNIAKDIKRIRGVLKSHPGTTGHQSFLKNIIKGLRNK